MLQGEAYFCKSGHHLKDRVLKKVSAQGFLLKKPETCKYCGSTEIKKIYDWEDPHYFDSDRQPEVSLMPIKIERLNTGEEIPVYDVSRLFNNY